MDWDRLWAAVIRGIYTVLLPMVGALIVWLLEPGVLEDIGVTNEMAALVIGAVLYAVKKFAFPDSKL